MVRITQEEMPQIAPLFAGSQETMIWSCLQGEMGKAWADRALHPRCAGVISGDFCYLIGDSGIREAEELVQALPAEHTSPFLLIIPLSEGWDKRITARYGDRAEKTERYALKKEKDAFDRNRLASFVERLPQGYTLRRIDRSLYEAVLREEWSADLCSQFASYEMYEEKGLGFAVLHQGKVVCGASSYTVYQGGIEIEIDTRKDFRRKGLARACAARLILECLSRDLYPSWDAANRASLALAESLGYRFDKAYATYVVRLAGEQPEARM